MNNKKGDQNKTKQLCIWLTEGKKIKNTHNPVEENPYISHRAMGD